MNCRWGSSCARRFAFGIHQLETTLELLVARLLERDQRAGVVEELFASQRAAAAGLAALKAKMA